jgi:D-aminoacyl-tRNA deacylase
MKTVVQRVSRAKVVVDGQVVGAIQHGLLVLLGVHHSDTSEQAKWICHKIANLRIFNDADDKMNLSIKDVEGEILLVSQFTLYANSEKGFRPSFIDSARPEHAIKLYNEVIEILRNEYNCSVKTGQFGAMMAVELVNDGPVTILLERLAS